MTKLKILFLSIIVLIFAVVSTSLVACEFREQITNQPKAKLISLDTTNKTHNNNINEPTENELPPESFSGTVAYEESNFMVVAPNIDEMEYTNYGKYIRVEFLNEHYDYRYGIGRKVVVTYIPSFIENTAIITDDIRTDGFDDFTLTVQYKQDSITARFAEIQPAGILTYVANNRDFDEYASNYNLYYYGLHDVYVTVDGSTLPLIEALKYGKATLDGIIAECNRLSSINVIEEYEYKDGGSILFDFGDFKIIKYHTLDGNRDVYIGTKDMDINAKNATSLCIGVSPYHDMGLRLETKNVTAEGATIVFNHFDYEIEGELQTGEAFYPERLEGNKWVSVETNPLIDYAFFAIAYNINKGETTELETNWEWLYGSLGSGKYRIAKEISNFKNTGNSKKQIYYAYFEI